MEIFYGALGATIAFLTFASIMVYLHLRAHHATGDAFKSLQEKSTAQGEQIANLIGMVTDLRTALVEGGMIQRPAFLPPVPVVIPDEARRDASPPPEQAKLPVVKPAEPTPIEVPRDSEAHGIPLEKMGKFHGEQLEDIDAFADAKGLAREEAIKEALLNGLDKIEAYAREHQLTPQEAFKIFLAEYYSTHSPTPTPTEPITGAEHCHGPLCVDGGSACMCSCPRCEPAPR